VGIPKYTYIVDEKTGLISAHVMLDNTKVFKGDPSTTHEQAAESAAKKAYKVKINARYKKFLLVLFFMLLM